MIEMQGRICFLMIMRFWIPWNGCAFLKRIGSYAEKQRMKLKNKKEV